MLLIHPPFGRRLTGFLAATVLLAASHAPQALALPADVATPTVTGDNSRLTLSTTFVADSGHVGRNLHVFMLAVVPLVNGTAVLARTPREWVPVTTREVPPLLSGPGSLSAQALPIVEAMDVRSLNGTVVYVGYGLGDASAGAFDEMLQAGRYRAIHTVRDALPWALKQTDAAGLTAYFRSALGKTGSSYPYTMSPDMVGIATGAPAPTPPMAAVPGGTAATPIFSGTTLQEAGVDEADLIKSDGSQVFSLDPAEGNPYRRDRLRRQRLDATASDAALMPVDSLVLPLSADVSASGVFLDAPRQQLLAVAQGNAGQDIYTAWFSPWYWSQGVTEAVLVDASNPASMQTRRNLRMTGQLIGSRRVGSTVYLVLRNYPQLAGLDPWWPTDKVASNQALVDSVAAADLLPTISIDGGPKQALVDAASCFVQQDNASVSADIITIVGIDLAATGHRHAARCFTGGAEAFYMSEQSVYLATTRSRYTMSGSFPKYPTQSSTDLHKFSLSGLDISYRGSGNVSGHLGFDQNRKSFRMGEHNGLLRVITQTEPSFSGRIGIPMPIPISPPIAATDTTTVSTATASKSTSRALEEPIASPGHLSILQESGNGLRLVSQLPNAARPAPLGKPGEQLYASRFLGERGYLVTYRLTDPLYVLDLSNPADPKIAGELEISGYSDYLFPISENLLLGVGKDALSDGSSGDGRFAWYQGVKVSLIDVSDPANPRESARALIGRRGTDATVLHDHHGIALQTIGRTLRVGLPVSVHDTPSPYSTGSASDYFQFSRTELQRFEINLDQPTINPLAAVPSSVKGERMIDNDRSLLWNDQVHYYQNGAWRSTAW